MPSYFLDTSALVKRYVAETGTAWVTGIVAPASANLIYLARVTGVEMVSAIVRRARVGHLSAADAVSALAQFRTDFKHRFQVVGVTVPLVRQAMAAAETHALRGYDAVQLAAALQVQKRCLALGQFLTLVSADAEPNAAAILEGLRVEDPNMHP
jgi:predicted nucleic acid-binding protein